MSDTFLDRLGDLFADAGKAPDMWRQLLHSHFLLAAVNSEAVDGSDFAFRRSFMVAVCVDAGEDSKSLSQQLAEDVRRVAEDNGCSITRSFGPFEASQIITLFGHTNEPETQTSFFLRLKNISDQITSLAKKLPLMDMARIGGATIKVVVSVATMATVLTAAPGAGLVVGAFVVPYSVLQSITVAGDMVEVARELHSIFFDSVASRKAQEEKKKTTQEGKNVGLNLGFNL